MSHNCIFMFLSEMFFTPPPGIHSQSYANDILKIGSREKIIYNFLALFSFYSFLWCQIQIFFWYIFNMSSFLFVTDSIFYLHVFFFLLFFIFNHCSLWITFDFTSCIFSFLFDIIFKMFHWLFFFYLSWK